MMASQAVTSVYNSLLLRDALYALVQIDEPGSIESAGDQAGIFAAADGLSRLLDGPR